MLFNILQNLQKNTFADSPFNSFMTDLQAKSMDLFLYDRDLRHERANKVVGLQHKNIKKPPDFAKFNGF